MLDDEISVLIKKTVEAAIAPVLSQTKSNGRTLDLLKEDLDHDREALAAIRTSQALVEQRSKEIVDMYSNIARRVERKSEQSAEHASDAAATAVANLVEPAVEASIEKVVKKVSNGTHAVKRRSHWWTDLFSVHIPLFTRR